MKNLFLLKTEKPSRLSDCHDNKLHLDDVRYLRNYKNIYITSDEEIIGGKEWFLDLTDNSLFKNQTDKPMSKVLFPECKKIVLTTDQDLIKDGVQAIDDEFLEWFVKNPNCEEVKVVDVRSLGVYGSYYPYKIVIPKEEHKQGSIVEAVKEV